MFPCTRRVFENAQLLTSCKSQTPHPHLLGLVIAAHNARCRVRKERLMCQVRQRDPFLPMTTAPTIERRNMRDILQHGTYRPKALSEFMPQTATTQPAVLSNTTRMHMAGAYSSHPSHIGRVQVSDRVHRPLRRHMYLVQQHGTEAPVAQQESRRPSPKCAAAVKTR